MHEFDKANLKHPIFREEYGGVSAIIPREIFMSIRGGQGSMGADDAENIDITAIFMRANSPNVKYSY